MDAESRAASSSKTLFVWPSSPTDRQTNKQTDAFSSTLFVSAADLDLGWISIISAGDAHAAGRIPRPASGGQLSGGRLTSRGEPIAGQFRHRLYHWRARARNFRRSVWSRKTTTTTRKWSNIKRSQPVSRLTSVDSGQSKSAQTSC